MNLKNDFVFSQKFSLDKKLSKLNQKVDDSLISYNYAKCIYIKSTPSCQTTNFFHRANNPDERLAVRWLDNP